jgi:hypothetical protein
MNSFTAMVESGFQVKPMISAYPGIEAGQEAKLTMEEEG